MLGQVYSPGITSVVTVQRNHPCNLCVGVYNLKKALVVIVKSSRRLVCSSSESVGHVYSGHLTWSPSLEGGGGHCGYQAAFHAGLHSRGEGIKLFLEFHHFACFIQCTYMCRFRKSLYGNSSFTKKK